MSGMVPYNRIVRTKQGVALTRRSRFPPAPTGRLLSGDRSVPMVTWQEFATAAPDLAGHGRRLLLLEPAPADQYAAGLAYLATVRKDGGPRIHPISPVLGGGRLYAFILRISPKHADLRRDGRYALHAFPHPLQPDSFNDEEFYLAGHAVFVADPALRATVAQACWDDPHSRDIFELRLDRVLRKSRPEGVLTYTKWRSPST